MSVAEETPIASSVANGVTKSFPYGFTVPAEGDLKVTGLAPGAAAPITYELNVDYALTGIGTPSGSVEFVVEPPAGTIIIRERVMRAERATDFQENGDLLARTLNLDIDRIWYALQDRIAAQRTFLRLPAGEDADALPPASQRLGKALTFDPVTGAFRVTAPAAGTADALAAELINAALSTAGAGMSGYGASVSYPPDTVGGELRRLGDVDIDPTDARFGAVGDGVANDTAAIQSALDHLASIGGGSLSFPLGSFYVDDQLDIPVGVPIRIRGRGRSTIIHGLLAEPDSAKHVFRIAGTSVSMCPGVTIESLTIRARYYGSGIKASYCYPKLTIRDVSVWKPVDDGIVLEECWGASVYDVLVDGDNATQGNGIHIVNANAVCLYNPRVYNMKNSVQSRGIYATSAESFSIVGGNIENCPRGIHVSVNGTYDGPVYIGGVYFEPRGMSPWDAGQPNDHILIEGDTTLSGAATVENCLFQPGNSGVPIAFNGITARNLGVLTVRGSVWQKAKYTAGGQGENYFVDADSTVGKVIQEGNFLVSTSLGNLNTISTDRLSVNNYNDDGTNDSALGPIISLLVRSTGSPPAALYRDAVVGASAGLGTISFGARRDATTYAAGADISAVSDGVWGASASGANLDIATTPSGSTTKATRIRFRGDGHVEAGADNTQTFGTASKRWSVLYAGTGTINTSDARTKCDVRALSDAERAVAVRLKGLLLAFRFNDAVATKGDGARIHFGVMAQDVADAFAAEGLDPARYALWCHDTWEAQPAVLDEDGRVVREAVPAGDRYGIRYEELLAFVLGAL